ncbi:MAG: PrsW family intramembrane metalloprotease [Chloroflexi bacterium]|nr:PrsW family intramembrane metalloprotease [Chloroflexota bacterium]
MEDTSLRIKHVLTGSPLRQPVYAVLFGIALIALLLLGAYNLLWPLYGGAPLILQTFITGAFVAIIVSIPAVAVVWYLDRREHEWPWLLLGAALWGAVVSASMSSLLGSALYGFFLRAAKQTGGTFMGMTADSVTTVFATPIVEEIIKGIAILILFWLLRADFDDLRDGLVYGAMVGLGFNAAQYAVNLLDAFVISGRPPYLGLGALQFVFLGVNGHFIYSALFGAGFGLSRQLHDARLKILAPLGGILLAILANILANSVGSYLINSIAFALTHERLSLVTTRGYIIWISTALATGVIHFWAYILLVIAVIRSEAWEVKTIREYLFSEVGVSVTPDEYVQIELDAPFQGRMVPGYPKKIATAILDAQDELAFRKWHVEHDGGDVEQDEMVQAWRAYIAQLRTRGRASAH